MTMTYSHLDPAMHHWAVWNAGKTVGTKRPLTQKHTWAIRFSLNRVVRPYYRQQAARSDLVKLKIGGLVAGADIRTRALVIQQKTGWPVKFEITADVRGTLRVAPAPR